MLRTEHKSHFHLDVSMHFRITILFDVALLSPVTLPRPRLFRPGEIWPRLTADDASSRPVLRSSGAALEEHADASFGLRASEARRLNVNKCGVVT